MRTNKDKIVRISVMGEIAPAKMRSPYSITTEGTVKVIPVLGGITYNVKIGYSAYGWEGDHVEPGVSVAARRKEEEIPLMTLSCIGNEAVVMSGDAKGSRGMVTGKHGGVNHVIVHFEDEVLEKLMVGDKILIKAWGQGLKLIDYPKVKVMNVDPDLLERIGITEENGKLRVPVVAKIPAHFMGSGIGASSSASTDYDIMALDSREFGVEDLKLGDLVAIMNHDNSYGVGKYKRGSISIGVVVHSACVSAGHGPGVVVIMTGEESVLVPEIAEKSNISECLNLR
ncbi:DUF4438 domain-containing protein [Thermotoga sp. KOL6]|uniref:DUF4438 domain-containing protein n=1 Tax=Thermotoga sp. KOL6 TaxID=126741 RepID=UPI000C782F63|nr:DUF4438 domain-containing protein [Thermotoga sp. KOL6]PLV59824.1 hypothetical protein AS005_00535 [Thermotoga sp. KOL6]